MKYKINSETLELLIPTLRAMPEYQISADIKLVLNIRTNRPYTLSDQFYSVNQPLFVMRSRVEPLASTCKVVTT